MAIPRWKQYQRDVAQLFVDLGFHAETDVTVTGARGPHDVDVVVRTTVAGIDVLWLVECKSWRRKVSRDAVILLHGIVADAGADRGLLMSESGYQRGALAAAQVSNIGLLSLAQLREMYRPDMAISQLKQLYRRAVTARLAYWELDKETRIKYGLRGDIITTYNGDWVAHAIEAAVLAAVFDGLPVIYDEMLAATPGWTGRLGPDRTPESVVVDDPETLVALLAPRLEDLEQRLANAQSRT